MIHQPIVCELNTSLKPSEAFDKLYGVQVTHEVWNDLVSQENALSKLNSKH